MDIKELLNNTRNEYASNYVKILTNFYPAISSLGFEERNQTNNFVNALIKCAGDENAIAWFEASISGNEKIDAVVFSPLHQSVFFIEAKRISNGKVNIKKAEIISNFNRLCHINTQKAMIDKWKTPIEFPHRYIIYLADVWSEAKETLDISLNWETWFNKLFAENENNPEFIYADRVNFDYHKHVLRNYKNTLHNYNLLISAAKITSILE